MRAYPSQKRRNDKEVKKLINKFRSKGKRNKRLPDREQAFLLFMYSASRLSST